MSSATPRLSGRLRSAGSVLRNVLWMTASQVALHGLCPMNLEKHWMRIERRSMQLPGLGEEFEHMRIVHLSDLHCSPILREEHLNQAFDMVLEFEPDCVVITGDFITASARHYARRMGRLIRRLTFGAETFAVLGNHDYGLWHPNQPIVRGLGEYLTGQLTDGGARVLINEAHTIRRGTSELTIAGAGEFWTPHYNPEALLADVPPERPTIALTHNPDAAPKLASLGASYVLAGHTHGRGVADSTISKALYPVDHRQLVAGLYELPARRYVYINRGLGPSRRTNYNTRPEITLFTLRRAARPKCIQRSWSGTAISHPAGTQINWRRPEPARA